MDVGHERTAPHRSRVHVSGLLVATVAVLAGLGSVLVLVGGGDSPAEAQPIPCEQWQQMHPGWPCADVPTYNPQPTQPQNTGAPAPIIPSLLNPPTQQGGGPGAGALTPPPLQGPPNMNNPIVPVPGYQQPVLPGNEPSAPAPVAPPAASGNPSAGLPETSVPGVSPSSVPGTDIVSQLERAAKLHEQGVLSDKEFADVKQRILHGETVEPVAPSPSVEAQQPSPETPDRRIPLLLTLAAAAFTVPARRIGRDSASRPSSVGRLAGSNTGPGSAFNIAGGLIRQVDRDQSNEITIAEPFGGVGDSYTVHLLPDGKVDGVTIYKGGKVIVETLFQDDGSWLVWVDDNSYYRIDEDGTVHKLMPSTGQVLEDNAEAAEELAKKLKLSNLEKMLGLLAALGAGMPNRELPPGFGPRVVPKPDPPGESPVPKWEYHNHYGTNNFGIDAEVSKDGVLDYVIEAGPDSPVKGSQMFEDMWNEVGPNVTAINGTWVNKPREGVVTNLESFNNAIAEGATPEQAAFATFTGKMAFRHGFRFVQILNTVPPQPSPGPYTSVEVVFTR